MEEQKIKQELEALSNASKKWKCTVHALRLTHINLKDCLLLCRTCLEELGPEQAPPIDLKHLVIREYKAVLEHWLALRREQETTGIAGLRKIALFVAAQMKRLDFHPAPEL